MSIPIGGGGRNNKRRTYASYNTKGRRPLPLFQINLGRVLIYLIAIAAVYFVYRNADVIRGVIEAEIAKRPVIIPIGPSPTPTEVIDYVSEAEQAYQAGQIDTAIEAYHQAGLAEPNNILYPYEEARLLLYRSALEYGEAHDATLDDAVDAANRAILANPEDARGYAILGKILDWQGKPESALNQIQRAVEIDPNLAVGHSYLAEALIDLDRWDQAQLAIQRAIELDATNVDVLRDHAYVLESLGDYTNAQQQYEAALRVQPNLPNIKIALGRLYRVNGQYELALDQFFTIQTLYPQNALIPFEVGRTYETYIGDPVAAIEAYQEAVVVDPDYLSPWIRIGTLFYFQQNYLESAHAFEKAIELGAEENVDVLYQLGLAYAYQGECDKAIPVLQEARALAADDERILDLVNSGFETCTQPTPTPGGEEEATEEP